MPVKLLTVIGARPQFIKAAPVTNAFADHGGIDEVLVHTGQHFDSGCPTSSSKNCVFRPPHTILACMAADTGK